MVLLFAAGIIIDLQIDGAEKIWGWFFGFSIVLYLLCEYIHTKFLATSVYRASLMFYLAAVISFGGLWHSLFNTQDVPPQADVINSYRWESLIFKGEVYQIKETSGGNIQINVAVDTTVISDSLLWSVSLNLRTVVDSQEVAFLSDLGLGDRLHFAATIYPLEAPTNPHVFNYKSYLASQDIYIQSGLDQIYNIQKTGEVFSWNSIRRAVLAAIDHNFSHETAPLAKALLIGYKNELDQKTKLAFSRSGLSHIMAVSGLHVGFILAPFWIIIPFFWTFRYGKQVGLLLMVGLLLFYAGLTGFSASVTRASLTGGFIMYGRLFHKVRNSKNLTAVAAFIILLINPSDLLSIGFQLSFGAVYIILLVAPIVSKLIPNWIQYRWYGTPVMAMIISLIVQVGLFPLLGYYFGEFSLVGPLANAMVVPLLGIVVPLALLLLLPAMVWPVTVSLINTPVDYFLSGLNKWVSMMAGWEWSWLQVHIESSILFVVWIAIIFLIATLPIPRLRWKFVIILLGIFCWQQAQQLVQKFQTAPLALTVFDVGQGDATLIATPGGKHYLVDTGRWQPGYSSAEYVLIPYLEGEGIRKLDGIFLSHPHADHIGGMVELLQQVPIDTIYNSGVAYDSDLFKRYQQLAAEKNVPVIGLQAGESLTLEPGISLLVYGPNAEATSSNINNQSLIFEMIYGSTEFLFMGDAETEQEQQLVRSFPRLLNTDFLKVGHHGSKTSSSHALLEAASPAIGVASLRWRNRFGHPHKEAIRRMRRDSMEIHFTSLNGAVRVYSDGKTIHIEE
nr:DNA internalization-related competence protein ComEC/Rec2 [Fodinibius salsisoli]